MSLCELFYWKFYVVLLIFFCPCLYETPCRYIQDTGLVEASCQTLDQIICKSPKILGLNLIFVAGSFAYFHQESSESAFRGRINKKGYVGLNSQFCSAFWHKNVGRENSVFRPLGSYFWTWSWCNENYNFTQLAKMAFVIYYSFVDDTCVLQ